MPLCGHHGQRELHGDYLPQLLILPANIAAEGDTADVTDNTPLAAGFTLKYTDQLVADGKKEQKAFRFHQV